MIESKQGDNVLQFDEKKHIYKLNGEIIPGVTTIKAEALPTPFHLQAWKVSVALEHLIDTLAVLKTPVNEIPKKTLDELVKMAKGAGRKKAQEAADIGSILHDYAEQYEKKSKITKKLHSQIVGHKDKAKILSCIKKFRRWLRQNHDKVIKHEEICASVLYKFGGKFDRLALRNGHIVLSDYKTSKGIYPDHFIQLGGYAIALFEWFGIQVSAVEIIRFGKEDGEFEVKTIDDFFEIEALRHQFIRCVGTYNFFREREGMTCCIKNF